MLVCGGWYRWAGLELAWCPKIFGSGDVERWGGVVSESGIGVDSTHSDLLSVSRVLFVVVREAGGCASAHR